MFDEAICQAFDETFSVTVTVLLNEEKALVFETTIFFTCHETFALTRSYIKTISKKEIIDKNRKT